MAASDPVKITCTCPGCGRRYLVGAAAAGKTARCKKCGAAFEVSAAAEATAAPAGHDPEGPLCAICQCAIQPAQDATACPECGAPYHRECWEYNKGCAIYGCSEAPPTEHLSSLEIPVSYWGKEEKTCPSCKRVILAAAVRCRYCGATFASARPEDAREFSKRTNVEKNLPGLRRASIWLLVFSVLTCTAPLAAIFGALWYFRHREEIQALPAIYGAVCKIAVVLAVGQTALTVVVMLLYSLFAT